MASERKLYIVKFGGTPAVPEQKALVSATNGARAERHIAREVLKIEASRATPAEAHAMAKAGAEVVEAQEG